MLFTCGSNGTPFSMPVSRSDSSCDNGEKSCVFRIEKIDGCCATFRVLVPKHCSESVTSTFEATDSIFTIDINCICAIRCLNDTFVDCL
jgi:spore coat protein Z